MNKFIILGVIGIFILAVVGITYAVESYFHSTTTTLTVDEARTSADMPVTLAGFSGDTLCRDVTISNAGMNDLKSVLSYVENSNPDNVTYTSNLDGGLTVTTHGNETDTYQACFTFSPVTTNGTVGLTIYYTKSA